MLLTSRSITNFGTEGGTWTPNEGVRPIEGTWTHVGGPIGGTCSVESSCRNGPTVLTNPSRSAEHGRRPKRPTPSHRVPRTVSRPVSGVAIFLRGTRDDRTRAEQMALVVTPNPSTTRVTTTATGTAFTVGWAIPPSFAGRPAVV